MSDPIMPPKIGASVKGEAHTVNVDADRDDDTQVAAPLADTQDEIAPEELDLEDDVPSGVVEWREHNDLLFDYDAADEKERARLEFEVAVNTREAIADIRDAIERGFDKIADAIADAADA